MVESANPVKLTARKVITTRAGGVSQAPFDSFNLGDQVGDSPEAVAQNRQRLQEILQVPYIVWLEQAHTNTVLTLAAAELEQGQGQIQLGIGDAVVTTLPNVALAVVTADCVPVLLSDHEHGVVAAVHAGRMGARNGIVAKTVARMVELGAQPETMHALLGPAASGRRYEVPDAMAQDVEQHLPGSRCRTVAGTTGLDIRAGITVQLLNLGVGNIDQDERCTISSGEFFSYRREGKRTGRQASVVWLTEDNS